MEAVSTLVSTIVAVLVAAGALGGWYLQRRSEQLRRDDVLAWANEAIEALQSIVIICRLAGDRIGAEEANIQMSSLIFRTSVLVEQGRLFFKNVEKGNYGIEKPRAYRGLRPKILDYLVIGHDVACVWPNASNADRMRLGLVTEDSLKHFVSAVQREVGRDRTAHDGAAIEGYGVHLPSLIATVTDENLRARGWLS